jgi:hypothetical protein
LFENGIDGARRIPGSPGMRPVLPNTRREEVESFRQQVEPIDMIGCTDITAIAGRVEELSRRRPDRHAPRARSPLPHGGEVTPACAPRRHCRIRSRSTRPGIW